MGPDVRNPAFSRAIPHVGVGICLLLQVVIFGSFGESQNGLIWGAEMVPFGDPKWTHLGTRNGPVRGPEMITEARAAAVRAGVVAKPSEG